MRRSFKTSKAIKNPFFAVLLLLVFDVVLAIVGSTHLGDKISFFSEKSAKTILSDLLFLEGAILFVLGTFAAYWSYARKRPSYEYDPERTTTSKDQLHQRHTPIWMLIIIMGTGLMGLAVAIAILPV